MPYTPTVWTDEVPASTPVKYKITDDSSGIIANSAKIELVTSVTAGTALNAANFNKLEAAVEDAVTIAESTQNDLSALELIAALVLGRQGGSSTDWNTAGTTNYTPSNIKIYVGSVQVQTTISSGSYYYINATPNFPAAFTHKPIGFAVIQKTSTSSMATVQVFSVTTTALAMQIISTANETITVYWLAIGD